MEDEQELVYDVSNSVIFNDPETPTTQSSKAQIYANLFLKFDRWL